MLPMSKSWKKSNDMRYTPENIQELADNEIFVFGSNLAGNHAGGAARTASEKFGAKWGVGKGLTGQSYAFPTLDDHFQKRSKECLLAAKINLYACAECNPDKTFLVTKLGLGIAGYSLEDIQMVFKGEKPENIILPKEFS